MNDGLCNRLIRNADIWDFDNIDRNQLKVLIKMVVLESVEIVQKCQAVGGIDIETALLTNFDIEV
jgi:hypothetical protein